MNVFIERGITHIDLHGLRHFEVDDRIYDVILRHQLDLPLIIICGNSSAMINLVKKILLDKSITFSEPRFGIIRIEKI